ncbi:MAG: PD-(D/E)XK nuclease family protein, partial [Marinoscillum sp.]
VESLVDREDKYRRKAAFQVFFYSYLFLKKYPGTYDIIEPGLFNSKDLFGKDFEWRIFDKTSKTSVTEFRQYLPEFELGLTNLLTEMYDPDIPFNQTEDLKKCGYCAYKEICGR